MKQYILYPFVLLASFYCANAQNVDPTEYAVLKYDISNYPINSLFSPIAKQATLLKDEIVIVEQLLEKCIRAYNVEQEMEYDKWKKRGSTVEKDQFVITLRNYRRQYISVINEKNEKIIWINCSPIIIYDDGHTDSSWRKHVIDVMDGGNAFFNVKVNLSKNTYFDLMVNGQ